MSRRAGAVVATAAIAAIVDYVGVIHFFRPIAMADSVATPPVPAGVGFFVYVVLSVLLLDWVSRQIGRPIKAALIIAASQIILVSIDFVLRGERGIATGVQACHTPLVLHARLSHWRGGSP
jgi:hypothetical protein